MRETQSSKMASQTRTATATEEDIRDKIPPPLSPPRSTNDPENQDGGRKLEKEDCNASTLTPRNKPTTTISFGSESNTPHDSLDSCHDGATSTNDNRDPTSTYSTQSHGDKTMFRTYTENMRRALWETIIPDELKHAHIIAKYCPLVAAIAAPLSTLLDIPALTQHWYDLDGVAQSDPTACLVLSAVGLALNIFANILLVFRFSSRTPFWWRMGTKLSLIFWLGKTIVAAVNLIIFGVATRNSPGYSYAEGFWCAVVSICDSGIISFTLLFHYFFAFGRREFDRQDIRMQGKKFMLSVTVLMGILALQALAFCEIEKWSYLDSIYFSVQTALTIGYGDLVPTTTAGKVLVFPFSVLSISQLGNEIAMIVSFIADRADQRRNKWRKRYEHAIHQEANRLRPNATLTEEMVLIHHINKREETMSQMYDLMWSALALIVFWAIGATIFSQLEGWTYGNAVYAVMVLSLTIGFGDFTPKTDAGRVVWIVYALMAVPIVTSFAVQTITGILSTWSEQRIDRERFIIERNRNPQVFSSHSEVIQRFHDLYDKVREHFGGDGDNDVEKDTDKDKIENADDESQGFKEGEKETRDIDDDNLRENDDELSNDYPETKLQTRTKSEETADSRTLQLEEDTEPRYSEEHDFKHGDGKNEDEYLEGEKARILAGVRRVQKEDEERMSEDTGNRKVGDEEDEKKAEEEQENIRRMSSLDCDDDRRHDGSLNEDRHAKRRKQTDDENVLNVDLLRQLVNRVIQLEAEARQMLLDSMNKGVARTLLLADRNVQIRDVLALRGDDANMVAIWRGEEDKTERDAKKRQAEHPDETDTNDDDMLSRVRRYRDTFAEILVISSILQRLEGEEQSRFERWRILEDTADALEASSARKNANNVAEGNGADGKKSHRRHHHLGEHHNPHRKGTLDQISKKYVVHKLKSRGKTVIRRSASNGGSLFGLPMGWTKSSEVEGDDSAGKSRKNGEGGANSDHEDVERIGDLNAVAEERFSGMSALIFKKNAKAIYNNVAKDVERQTRMIEREHERE